MNACVCWLVPVAILAALACTGCGDSHVSLERERIAVTKELTSMMTSAKNPNEMFDKAPQVEAIAARIEKLAERRSKLGTPSESQKSEIVKLREAERAEMKVKMEEWRSSMNPKDVISGGMPDLTKLPKFQSAMTRLAKASASYDPEFAAAAAALQGGGGGQMPGEGGLLKVPAP